MTLACGQGIDWFEYAADSFVLQDLKNDQEDLKLRRLFEHVSDIELDLLATELMLGKRNWTSTFNDEDGKVSYYFDAWLSNGDDPSVSI